MSPPNLLKRLSLAVAFSLAACAPAPPPPLALNDLQPLPTPATQSPEPLRVAVASVISPRGTVESYQPLLHYLAEQLARPVQLVQRRTYQEVNDLLAQGLVDVAFVCTSAYVEGHARFGMELLAAPQVNGQTVYYSALIVPAASPARTLADLRGRVFAFTDPMSHSGRAYPTYLVHQLGATPETFFARTFYTYSHDDAIRAVADGLADGAAVDSLVLDFALAREAGLAERIKVIHLSEPFGIPPVVVGPAVRPQLRAELQHILITMSADPNAQASLQAIGVERFVLLDDVAYDSVRDLRRQVEAMTP